MSAKDELRQVGREVAKEATSTLIGAFIQWIRERRAARRARKESAKEAARRADQEEMLRHVQASIDKHKHPADADTSKASPKAKRQP